MIYLKPAFLMFALFILACNQAEQKTAPPKQEASPIVSDDKANLRELIRRVYEWHETKSSAYDFVPLADNKDSAYVGLDLEKHGHRLTELKQTGLFSDRFLDNYNKIALTIDEGLKSKKLQWLAGDGPPFGNGADPWCNCQDVPYDSPDPWSLIDTEVVNLESDQGELNWKWGKPELNGAPGWKAFRYRFRVVKENGGWKIAYLEGFDADKFLRR